jgi:hypothetical protein
MSFNMWQKLIAASTENAVVAACCEAAVAEDVVTVAGSDATVENASLSRRGTPGSRAARPPL